MSEEESNRIKHLTTDQAVGGKSIPREILLWHPKRRPEDLYRQINRYGALRVLGEYNDPFEPILLPGYDNPSIALKYGKNLKRPSIRRVLRNSGKLAPITKNRINLQKLFEMDPELLEPLKIITDVEEFRKRLSGLPTAHKISRFMDRHLPDMIDFGVVEELWTPNSFDMTCFTTPKKDDTLRLILDCRPLNEVFERPPEMCLPKIHEFIDEILAHEYASQADGKSYFYQFSLHPEVAAYFGSRVTSGRGLFHYTRFLCLPMGFSWAPAIAQRASNVLVRDCGLCWVDNFVVLGMTSEHFLARRNLFLQRVQDVNLELDDTTLSPSNRIECLGIDLDLAEKRYRLSPSWVDKVVLRSCPIQLTTTIRGLYEICGTLIWRWHVMRQPLCSIPEVMRCLGDAARLVIKNGDWDEPFVVSELVRRELECAFTVLRENPWQSAIVPQTGEKVDMWSDASQEKCVFLLLQGDAILDSRRWEPPANQHIFLSELQAAVNGIVRAHERGHSNVTAYVDNAPAAIALERRVYTNHLANITMQLLPDLQQCQVKVKWVSTKVQRADLYTRAMPKGSGNYVPLPAKGTILEPMANRDVVDREGEDVEVEGGGEEF